MTTTAAEGSKPAIGQTVTPGPPLLSLRGIKKSFGHNVVLRGVDLDVSRGEVVVVMGPSGCGKTVLMKIIAGLIPADAGDIYFDSHPVSAMNDAELLALHRRVGIVFQSSALFDSMSVHDNVAYGLHEQNGGILVDSEIDERVRWALALVGLRGAEELLPAELSGGMQKRVGVARTIATRPDVVLYDEPTQGLDPANTTRVDRVIRRLALQLGVTSVVVTHNLTTAFAVAQRIAFLNEGVIAEVGPPEQVRDSSNPFIYEFLHAGTPFGATLPG